MMKTKGLKGILAITVLFVAVLVISVILETITQPQAIEYGKKGLLVALVLSGLSVIFSLMSKEK